MIEEVTFARTTYKSCPTSSKRHPNVGDVLGLAAPSIS